MKILVLNAGSSSQKSCLYDLGGTPPRRPLDPLWEAAIDWSQRPGRAVLEVERNGEKSTEDLPGDPRGGAVERMLETLSEGPSPLLPDLGAIAAVGHRVVHGGATYRQPTRVTPEVKQAIAELSALAPSHNPANLQGFETVEQLLPEVPQVAVFDTAFHAEMPTAAALYPGPYEWFEDGIRRYGFHGISHDYCARTAARLLDKPLEELRLITCHLGNGCSLAAVRGGRGVDTTMGFTPLDGLMMGTRSGSIDPGILIHLQRSRGLSADDLDRLLNRESGLKGVSGISGDMRHILSTKAEGNVRAQLAFDTYIHRIRRNIGSMLASLDGLDALVFSAGVGEHAPDVRAAACEGFGFLGLKLDPEANARSPRNADIASPDSRVRVLVIKTEEDWAIATATAQLLHAS
ncbi:acetate kinase [Rubidibacter lacunae KORDI 51-2]|uniref:Acetate kinase n=1 Tax=Rubidibacter lacunae KORDI 51-2 TaxID=582515 RepID=U5DCK4_9CHRO|nr:acetate kinase [Rubidibacter lacunae]ERN42258.1 acetate kinase [Rubidibacter lacunae KORDI 51-2]